MTRQVRVFVDSNVIFSASHKSPNNFEAFWAIPQVDILVSQYSIGEISRHLAAPDDRARLWRLIYLSHLVPEAEDTSLSLEIDLPKKDTPIFRSALAAKADILVTGDSNHFGSYYGLSPNGLLIESPAMFRNRYAHHFPNKQDGE